MHSASRYPPVSISVGFCQCFINSCLFLLSIVSSKYHKSLSVFTLGNGTQQFISIPVSMATGSNQQIQLLTTSNGQIVATNLSSLQALAQPLNLGLPAASKFVETTVLSCKQQADSVQFMIAQCYADGLVHIFCNYCYSVIPNFNYFNTCVHQS